MARNGQKFLTGLTERENKNPQFDFLKPTHVLFGFFTGLVDAYSRCLVPRKEELMKLQGYVHDGSTALERGVDRYDYQKAQMMAEKKAKDDKAREEEMEVAQIDWYDFAIVETISFDEQAELAHGTDLKTSAPPPSDDKIRKEVDAEAMEMDVDNEETRTLAAVARRLEAQEAQKAQKAPAKTVPRDDEIGKEPVKETPKDKQPHAGPIAPASKSQSQTQTQTQWQSQFQLPQPVSRVPAANSGAGMNMVRVTERSNETADMDMDVEPDVKIKTDYERKPAEEKKKGSQKCPKCGAFIPNDEFEKHLKMELVSPGYLAQKKEQLEKGENKATVAGDEMVANLEEFGKQRPDLFGTVSDQLPGEKEEPKDERSAQSPSPYRGPEVHLRRTDGHDPHDRERRQTRPARKDER